MASVHGGEFEGIVGIVNLIAVLETGADLRGRAWPGITAAASALDRIILIPILNADGRSRVPLRMGVHRGTDHTVAEYFNTGGHPDGSLIGWPDCKEFIPLDFAGTQFPGGYPNDAGVNVQHDDFFGRPQPETRGAAGPGRRGAPGPDTEYAHRRDVRPPGRTIRRRDSLRALLAAGGFGVAFMASGIVAGWSPPLRTIVAFHLAIAASMTIGAVFDDPPRGSSGAVGALLLVLAAIQVALRAGRAIPPGRARLYPVAVGVIAAAYGWLSVPRLSRRRRRDPLRGPGAGRVAGLCDAPPARRRPRPDRPGACSLPGRGRHQPRQGRGDPGLVVPSPVAAPSRAPREGTGRRSRRGSRRIAWIPLPWVPGVERSEPPSAGASVALEPGPPLDPRHPE